MKQIWLAMLTSKSQSTLSLSISLSHVIPTPTHTHFVFTYQNQYFLSLLPSPLVWFFISFSSLYRIIWTFPLSLSLCFSLQHYLQCSSSLALSHSFFFLRSPRIFCR